MKKIVFGVVGVAALAIGLVYVASPVSALRAFTNSGEGCYVRVGPGDDDYLEDESCQVHTVIKRDDDGNLEFYHYQDQGQLPDGGWRPTRALRTEFEQCLWFASPLGPVQHCGTANEVVSPSGEYKSSLKIY